MPLSTIDASDSLQMASGYACQRCSHLPPPPMFSISPPPNVFAIEVRCTSSPSLVKPTSKTTHSPSSSVSIVLGFLVALLIFSGTCLFIKKRLVHRRRRQRQKATACDESLMISSSSVKFHRRHQHDNHHQNWTKLIPLLSESCSSDQTSATPPHDYPCSSTSGVIEPLLIRGDLHHEYEQIKCDDSLSGSLHYYCLVYCRQCATYHPTSSSSTSSSSSLCPRANLIRPCYLPLSSHQSTCQHQCTCYHQQTDTRLFEHHPAMFVPRTTNNVFHHQPTEDLLSPHSPLKFIEETPLTTAI